MPDIFSYLTFAMVGVLLLIVLLFIVGWRWMMKQIIRQVGKIILTDNYQENIIEMIPSIRHVGMQNAIENSLRTETGEVLQRPLGSSKKWPHLDPITFIPAQTKPFPVDSEEEVDMRVIIGPRAKKPMEINTPLMIAGMAYGVALSEQVKLALTEAANNIGTAINSGEGGILPEELDVAGKYILQFSATEWGKEEEMIKRSDMIEIKLGQGALVGMGSTTKPDDLTGRARDIMGLKDHEDAVIYEHFFENQTLKDIKHLVEELRDLSKGVPIGIKIGAGGKIEEDIDHLIDIGVDFIALDGGQGATFGAPPILSEDFGIPTLHAVVRAVNHLEKRKVKGKISLIVSGGLLIPGHFLKVLALGADAVYLGTAALFTVSHQQAIDALPFEPPTQVIWNEGKLKDQFKVEQGVKATENFLTSCTEEMKVALRAMGKRSLKELSKKDLVSYDETTAKFIGIPYSFASVKSENV